MDTPKTDARLIRRFSEVIGLIDRGRLEQSLNEAMQEALTALDEMPGDKGKANITLNIEIAKQNDLVQVKPKLTVKLPEGGAFAPLVVWAHDGALSLQHPSQHDMFGPREVAPAEAKQAAAAE